MIYNLINGKIIIAKMYDEFNIKSRDWETRSPKWIADAMKYLNIRNSWKEVVEEIEFTDYGFDLPCNTKVLRGIVINNVRLTKSTVVGHQLTNQTIGQHTNENYFYNINAGRVELEIPSGTAKIVYWKLPVEWDDILGMWIPMIPDIPEVMENIAWYVLKIIIARGYVHPVYSLTTNSELNNPHLMWERTKRRAKNRANAMDVDTRAIMAETLSSFLVDPKSDINDLLVKARVNVAPVEQVLRTSLSDKVDAVTDTDVTSDITWEEVNW